jgi:hypothetical protein
MMAIECIVLLLVASIPSQCYFTVACTIHGSSSMIGHSGQLVVTGSHAAVDGPLPQCWVRALWSLLFVVACHAVDVLPNTMHCLMPIGWQVLLLAVTQLLMVPSPQC